ncbi:class I SAM-dependent methyltransferase [Kovacikia minuta CCNUW1]|uniref:SAM-dependent methyltransferase n=1 Tax=Kovacikia minuta TaxID=2931930 RepID=UPI001CCC67B9|nr:class I SAM-dependent methyltransferase [Kovacikia minuta]UBF28060.1 class I SAM-dependent methyltransferase [Kovacikia minuta CCNUW1]
MLPLWKAKWNAIDLRVLLALILLVTGSPIKGVSLPEDGPSVPVPNPTRSPLPNQSGGSSPATPDAASTEILKLAEVSNRDVVYHVGAGEGQLVVTAVKQFGAKRGVGVENSPDLVALGKANAQKAGVGDRVQFLQQDPYQVNFQEASVVILQLKPDSDRKLRTKLLKELKPGTRIISNVLLLGDWMPDKVVPVSNDAAQRLYYWVVPANIAGDWEGTLEYTSGRRQAYTIRFAQQFQRIKGDVIVNKQKYYISKIALRGDRLNFSRTETVQGQPGIAEFKGRVEGNVLKGTIQVQWGPLSRSFPILAKRSG